MNGERLLQNLFLFKNYLFFGGIKMLLQNNNQIANNVYLYYIKSIQNLEASAARVASGKKLNTASDGPGDLGVADLFSQKIKINNAFVNGMTTAQNFLGTQDTALDQAVDILNEMSDLATDALDTTLTTTDRIALDSEFQALEAEFTSLSNKRFNGLSLFGASLLVRIGLDSSDTMTITAVTLQLITFVGMTLSQLTAASGALISLQSRLSSLNRFVGRSGANFNRIGRTISFTQAASRNLQNSEDQIRNADLAIETGVFTRLQVVLASSQSVLTQSNNLIQSLLQFLS